MRPSVPFLLPLLAAGCAAEPTSAPAECDALRAQLDGVPGYALAIGGDGALFLGEGGAIARFGADGVDERAWYRGDGGVFDDLAWTPSRLYVSERTEGGSRILGLDPDAPGGQAAQVFADDVAGFGLAGGPDGALYFARADHTIARLAPGGVVLTEVTATPLPGAIGDLAFDEAGALLAITMFGGEVLRLELDDANREVARETVAVTGVPFVHALDVDGEGSLYYGGQGIAYRRRAPYGEDDVEVLAAGLGALAKIAVGRGDACPADVYISATPSLALAGE